VFTFWTLTISKYPNNFPLLTYHYWLFIRILQFNSK